MGNMDEAAGKRVPGMVEQIEARRRQLELSVGDLADLAGVTEQTLNPIRVHGLKKNYDDRTRRGLAAALQWPADALERIMNGETIDDERPTGAGSVEEALLAAGELTAGQRDSLLRLYRLFLDG